LSRELADSGHFPAIDVGKSISRVMPMVTSDEHQTLARALKQAYSLYQENKELITIGAYAKGSDPRVDKAILIKPKLDHFLQQKMKESISYNDCLTQLAALTQTFVNS
jgi:flagellum-specific ATP synthase